MALASPGCGTSSRARTHAHGHTSGPPQRAEPQGPFTQRGLASYYSNSLAGNRTASGERYQPSQLTAAHRTLPFGTTLRVTRLDRQGHPTGETVVVRVNDRGPFGGKRIIDLSFAAARALGMVRAGVVMVDLTELPGR